MSEYRGVVPREYDSEEQKRTDEELENYRVVRPGQLAVNSMWLNHLGLGVSDHLGHVSPAYSVYDISKRLDRRFVHHLMRSNYYLKVYLRYLYGIRPNSFQIKASDWASIPIIVPDLPTQRAIADFLDRETARIDTLIEKKQRLVELLGEKRLSTLTALCLGIPSGCGTAITLNWEPSVPEGWSVTFLKNIVDSRRSITYGIVQPGELDPNGILMIRGQDYSKGWASAETIFRVSPQIESPYARARLRTGDLLMTIVGAGVGNVEIVPSAFDGANITQTTARISLNKKIAIGQYFKGVLLSKIGTTNVENYKRGAAQPGLTLKDVSRFRVPLPPIAIQSKIAEEMAAEGERQSALSGCITKSIDRLKEYRSALITSAVTGQIDVTKWTNAGTTDRQLDAIEEEFGA